MNLKLKRAFFFFLAYFVIVLARALTQVTAKEWESVDSWKGGLELVWGHFAPLANQLLGGITAGAIIAFIGFGSSNDPRKPSDRIEKPMDVAMAQKAGRGIFFRGTFYPENTVLETIDKLKARVIALSQNEALVREQAEGNLFRLSRLEIFRWSLFCLGAAVLTNPLSAVFEVLVQRVTDPNAFVHLYAQSLALVLLSLPIGWIVSKRYYGASGDQGYRAAIVIPAVGFGFSGLALIFGILGSPDLSYASSIINVRHDTSRWTSYLTLLILIRLIAVPSAAILASLLRRFTLPAAVQS